MASRTTTTVPLTIQPGIQRNITAVQAQGMYVDGNMVRFQDGSPEKVGGWQKDLLSGTLIGVPRSALAWTALDSTRYIMVGTHNHLYVEQGGKYFDVTPIRATSALTDPFTTTSGDSEVEVEDVLHVAAVGDYIFIDGPISVGGLSLDGEYVITEVIDADNYVIDAGSNASSSVTGGGSVDIDYYIASGLVDTGVSSYGFGTGTYGGGTYGTPRTIGPVVDARVWCLNNWGEDALALIPNGAVYFWDTSAGTSTRAKVVATAPSQSLWAIVGSYFRQLILFGTETTSTDFDPLLIRWSDSEDYTEFTPSATNSSGEYRLTKGTKIVGAIETRGGEILVFTDEATYVMRPQNTDFQYEVSLVSDNSGLIGPMAVADIDGIVIWVSNDGYRMYDGTVRILPSTLDDFYFDPDEDGYISFNQKVKVHIGKNKEFSELWIFTPDNTHTEINRVVIYNYEENLWSDGLIERTAWLSNAVLDKPYAYNADGDRFIHEQGRNDDASAMQSYITTGFYSISDANAMMLCDRIIPDGEFTGPINLTIQYKKFPQSTEVFEKTYVFENDDEQVPVRVRGRFIALTYETNIYNGDMRLGQMFASVQENGGR